MMQPLKFTPGWVEGNLSDLKGECILPEKRMCNAGIEGLGKALIVRDFSYLGIDTCPAPCAWLRAAGRAILLCGL